MLRGYKCRNIIMDVVRNTITASSGRGSNVCRHCCTLQYQKRQTTSFGVEYVTRCSRYSGCSRVIYVAMTTSSAICALSATRASTTLLTSNDTLEHIQVPVLFLSFYRLYVNKINILTTFESNRSTNSLTTVFCGTCSKLSVKYSQDLFLFLCLIEYLYFYFFIQRTVTLVTSFSHFIFETSAAQYVFFFFIFDSQSIESF